MKKEKGITLIALIITIIVMLILVVVTLSITLGDNGIISKTKESKMKMNRETEREELAAFVQEARDNNTGRFDIQALTLPEGAVWITGKNDETVIPTPDADGNWMKTANGEKFFITSIGTVVDSEETGTITNGGTVTVGDPLDGTYYNRQEVHPDNYLIVSNGFVTISTRDGQMGPFSYEYNAESQSVTVPDMGMTLECAILSNNKIIRTREDEFFSTTMDGFDYSLDGEYVNSDSTKRITFNSLTHKVTIDGDSHCNNADYFGYKFANDGIYYSDDYTVFIVSNDNQTLDYSSETYTKVN